MTAATTALAIVPDPPAAIDHVPVDRAVDHEEDRAPETSSQKVAGGEALRSPR